ncbi:MAG: YbaK/EbsC family protein [Candidatus Aminicenantes bacterium]|nr:YbaK/EbsC family protein [Candidatus Aminicenantes bacterium]
MPLEKLIDFLEENNVEFTRIIHSKAYTAQVIAHHAHISGNMLAKTIVLKDSDEEFIMAVVPANYQVDIEGLSELYGKELHLATEAEFTGLFPCCETGGMPPFGNLFGLPVYVSETLSASKEIAFNAGDHKELLQMSFADFNRLVNPVIAQFSKKRS